MDVKGVAEAIVLFVVVLGFMVFIHELGHFVAAKSFGVRVETFSLGFGPRIWGFKRGDTDYRLSALPLGGYVRMAGEMPGDEHPEGAAREGDLTSKPRWQRIVIALAGPFSNFVLSLVLAFIIAHWHHEVDEYLVSSARIDYVAAGTPAAKAGMQTGDVITSFDGKANPTWDTVLEECALNLNHTVPVTFVHGGVEHSVDLYLANGEPNGDVGPRTLPGVGFIPQEQSKLITIDHVEGSTPAYRAGMQTGDVIEAVDAIVPHSVDTLHAYLKDRAGAASQVQLLRGGQTVTVTLNAEKVAGAPSYAEYQFGFRSAPSPVVIQNLGVVDATKLSVKQNLEGSSLILRVVRGMLTRHVSVKQVSGPVGIAQQIQIAAHTGTWALLGLTASISLNLGVFNLLPIPILDGGMILFLLIEMLMRRDVNEQIKERIYTVAFVCIVAFACFVIFNDITKLPIGRH